MLWPGSEQNGYCPVTLRQWKYEKVRLRESWAGFTVMFCCHGRVTHFINDSQLSLMRWDWVWLVGMLRIFLLYCTLLLNWNELAYSVSTWTAEVKPVFFFIFVLVFIPDQTWSLSVYVSRKFSRQFSLKYQQPALIEPFSDHQVILHEHRAGHTHGPPHSCQLCIQILPKQVAR